MVAFGSSRSAGPAITVTSTPPADIASSSGRRPSRLNSRASSPGGMIKRLLRRVFTSPRGSVPLSRPSCASSRSSGKESTPSAPPSTTAAASPAWPLPFTPPSSRRTSRNHACRASVATSATRSPSPASAAAKFAATASWATPVGAITTIACGSRSVAIAVAASARYAASGAVPGTVSARRSRRGVGGIDASTVASNALAGRLRRPDRVVEPVHEHGHGEREGETHAEEDRDRDRRRRQRRCRLDRRVDREEVGESLRDQRRDGVLGVALCRFLIWASNAWYWTTSATTLSEVPVGSASTRLWVLDDAAVVLSVGSSPGAAAFERRCRWPLGSSRAWRGSPVRMRSRSPHRRQRSPCRAATYADVEGPGRLSRGGPRVRRRAQGDDVVGLADAEAELESRRRFAFAILRPVERGRLGRVWLSACAP